MTRRIRHGCWAGLISVGLAGGCGILPTRRPATPPTHSSASLLETGPAARVTGKQTADIQFALGRTNEEADQLDGAESAYRSALSHGPKRGDVEARLAIVLDRKGKFAEADDHFARALKLDPQNPDLLCDRGYSFYLRDQKDEAEKALRAALALAPDHARSHTNLGLIRAAQGDSTGALAEFSRAGTDPADARANLALALALAGKVQDARDQYALALQAKPKSTAAAEGLRVANNVLKAGSTPPKDLPGQPVDSATALAQAKPRTDPALIPTSIQR